MDWLHSVGSIIVSHNVSNAYHYQSNHIIICRSLPTCLARCKPIAICKSSLLPPPLSKLQQIAFLPCLFISCLNCSEVSTFKLSRLHCNSPCSIPELSAFWKLASCLCFSLFGQLQITVCVRVGRSFFNKPKSYHLRSEIWSSEGKTALCCCCCCKKGIPELNLPFSSYLAVPW